MDPLFTPVTNEADVETLLRELPVAIDRRNFSEFVLGFPRRYLVTTPRFEIVKHYLLLEGLGRHSVMTSLIPDGGLWKLAVITQDREFLFSRITGSLSCFGMNIVSAEAFANANALVLDQFRFYDPEQFFASEPQRQSFRKFLVEVLESQRNLNPHLEPRLRNITLPEPEELAIRFDNESHPSATRLTLDCRDQFGLLYLVSCRISSAGCNIEMAYVQTPGKRVHDEFYLTTGGNKLDASMQEGLQRMLLYLTAGAEPGERPVAGKESPA